MSVLHLDDVRLDRADEADPVDHRADYVELLETEAKQRARQHTDAADPVADAKARYAKRMSEMYGSLK